MSLSMLGAIPDGVDHRDWTVAKLKIPRAGPCDIVLPTTRAVRNQVGGSCVANAWCNAIEINADLHGKPCPDLSAQFLYTTARYFSGGSIWTNLHDVGTMPRAAATALTYWGVAPAYAYPNDYATLNEEPTALAKVAAADWRAETGKLAYHRAGSLADIDAALAAGLPVVAAWQVGADWFTHDGVKPLEYPAIAVGGHAVCIVGKRETCYEILNSWGENWGRNGRGLLSSAYAARFTDAWTGGLSWL